MEYNRVLQAEKTLGERKLTGMLAEYISYAKDCLGNQTLKFKIQDCNDYDEMLQALIYDNDQDTSRVFHLQIYFIFKKGKKSELRRQMSSGTYDLILMDIQMPTWMAIRQPSVSGI